MAMTELPRNGAAGLDRQMLRDRTPHLLGAILGVLGFAAVLFLLGDRLPTGLPVLALGLFATFGIFLVLGLVFGVIRISARRSGEAVAAALLRDTEDGVLVAAADGSVLFSNGPYQRLGGSNGVLSEPDGFLPVAAESRDRLAEMRADALDGQPAADEIRVGEGEAARWFRIDARPIRIDDERRHSVAWVVSDLTDTRRAQEASFVAARDTISYLDDAPFGFFAVRRDGIVAHLNARLAGLLSIDLTEFRRTPLQLDDLLAPDHALVLEAAPVDTSGTRWAPVELVTQDGYARPVAIGVREAADGQRLGVVLDTTALGGAGGADAPWESYFNNAPLALARIRADGSIATANGAFATMFASVARRERLADLLPDEAYARAVRALDAAASGRVDIEPVDLVIPSDGRGPDRFLRLTMTPAPARDGDAAAILHVSETTEQRAIEARYVQGEKMQLVGQLAGGIAHDFNNVLTSIMGSAEQLLENHTAGDPSHPAIRQIKADAERAAALVAQLLAFSRKQTMQPAMVMLSDKLADARTLFQRMARNCTLEMELGPDLWPIRADITQFEQVLSNLVKNARQAMPEGGTISISARNLPEAEAAALPHAEVPAADYVLVEVADTGHGMPPEVVRKIFEPFFTTKEVGQGTGLGLAMAYGTIKQSGGFIHVDSEVGRGTRFRILLPRHIPTEEDRAAIAAEKKVGSGDLTGTGTILLVEDETNVRNNAVRYLSSRGYTVHDAADGEEALEILEELEGKVDLVLSDVVMPVMDGPTLLRELRATYGESIPFVFASGHAQDAFAKSLPPGAKFGFIPKPYTVKALSMKVKEAMDAGG